LVACAAMLVCIAVFVYLSFAEFSGVLLLSFCCQVCIPSTWGLSGQFSCCWCRSWALGWCWALWLPFYCYWWIVYISMPIVWLLIPVPWGVRCLFQRVSDHLRIEGDWFCVCIRGLACHSPASCAVLLIASPVWSWSMLAMICHLVVLLFVCWRVYFVFHLGLVNWIHCCTFLPTLQLSPVLLLLLSLLRRAFSCWLSQRLFSGQLGISTGVSSFSWLGPLWFPEWRVGLVTLCLL